MQIRLVCAFEEWNIGKFKTLNNLDIFFFVGIRNLNLDLLAHIIVGGKSLHLPPH